MALTDVPGVGTVEILVQSPLTVLSGPNGVGKTALLRAIWAALQPAKAAPEVSATKRLTAGSALVDLSTSHGTETAEVAFMGDKLRVVSSTTVSVQHVNSAANAPLQQRAFCAFESAEEIVNGAGPRELDPEALSEVSYILNRAYRRVVLYEVEMDGTVPFFEVTYGDDRYDSRTMGAGEMSALYIWWALRQAEPNSVLLVEEPETFLSFGCQRSLAGFLVQNVVEKRLVSVVTSNSSAFISALPRESLKFLSRGRAGVTVLADQPPPILLKSIGIELPVIAIVFVEDELAGLFCRAILEKYDSLLSRQLHVQRRTGDGEVKSALKPLLSVDAPIKFVGLFDGDLRDDLSEEYRNRSAFLPGNEPVEILFRDMVNADTDLLSEELEHRHLDTVLTSLEGRDHHDWYTGLATELGLSKDQLFSALFSVWVRLPDNEQKSLETVNAISELVKI